jgi:hypothetical protein
LAAIPFGPKHVKADRTKQDVEDSTVGDEVLLRFLSNGLIDVSGDDTKLEKLMGTAADLTAALKKTPPKQCHSPSWRSILMRRRTTRSSARQ